MGLYFQGQQGSEAYNAAVAVKHWMQLQPSWHTRTESGQLRLATAQEVAEALLDDPEVQVALAVLASPAGQAVEEVGASLYLPGRQAKLLSEGLTVAWNKARNPELPIWRRTEYLVGGGVVLLIIILGAWTYRTRLR